MATRPAEPTTLGKFFDYPQGLTGLVAPYWLATSPGSGHRVRMTGACKKAFLATIEAVIERALAPANCGTAPGANTDFTAEALDANGTQSLISLTQWNSVASRSGLGSRLKRGCPLEDWSALVAYVAALWACGQTSIGCGDVYAWQTDMLSYATGWRSESDGHLDITDMTQLLDLCGYFADDDSFLDGVPSLRPWGLFPGGNMLTPVTDWVAGTLTALGANVDTGSGTALSFAEEQLNGSPAPLEEGHEGNWFGSSASALLGAASVRRSSSAWAVLQSMLANMRFTHLRFPYDIVYDVTTSTRTITRTITMDDGWNIVVTEVVSDSTMANGTSTDVLWKNLVCSSIVGGLSWIGVNFYCADEDIDENNPLVKFSFPGGDGWFAIGSDLEDYLHFGDIHSGAAVLTVTQEGTTGVHSVSAGNGHAYPADAFAPYVGQYGAVTFIDRRDCFNSGNATDPPDTTEYRVHGSGGNRDLSVPVASHARWLLDELPSIPYPNIPANPGTLGQATSQFWNGWKVQYPSSPNIQVNGLDAYFPIAFKNPTVIDRQGWAITHSLTDHDWKGGTGSDPNLGEVFGIPEMAFPNFDPTSVSTPLYRITDTSEAMAAYRWEFKAMPA